jgi:hypothetical protein
MAQLNLSAMPLSAVSATVSVGGAGVAGQSKSILPQTMIIMVCLTLAFLTGCTESSDRTISVSGVVDGKPLTLTPSVQKRLAEETIDLLKSCHYANLHPTNQYEGIASHAMEQSHLHFTFSEPRRFQVHVPASLAPSGSLVIELIDMVITLPLSSGAILVHSNQETYYFAKWDCDASKKLEKTLERAVKLQAKLSK